MERNIVYSLLCMLFICITACMDEPLGGEDDFTPGGKSMISATVEFNPLVPALNGTSRANGNAIESINSIWMLLYDTEGKLVKDYKIENVISTPIDRHELTGGPYAETETHRATFNQVIPQGRYYIYAVVNLDLTSYSEEIKTIDGLKNISLEWQDKIELNNQMFGHFSEDSKENDNVIHVTPELLTINKNMKLHAWVRRAASKVTIAYDGSQLEEGVFIYLKSVRIKDIPRKCLLGNENQITDTKDLIANGETINYYPESSSEPFNYDETWPARITAGMPYYPYEKKIDENGKTIYEISKDAHSETANALFFYENMQREGRSKKQANANGGIANPVEMDENGNYKKDENGNVIYDTKSYKDEKPYGTYIEVEAYYHSIHEERVGSGRIIYRFMLGKDTDKDYNAERNFHYKLTLCFKNFANDVDWHIEYEEKKPDILLPSKYYISYLYNNSLNMPLKINTGGQKLVALKAEILTNNWAPHNATNLDYAKAHDHAVTPTAPEAPWNGFLSLRKTKAIILSTSQAQVDVSQGIVYAKDNESYYKEHKRGERDYDIGNGTHEDDENGNYTVSYDNEKEIVNVSIPLYTRAKQLITNTGYTGNNPYVAYQRHAEVEITATIQDENGKQTKLTGTSDIFQVRRIVNPKGIYRSETKNTPFHVKLMRLPQENGTTFETFPSEGAWRAYVIAGDSDFITLNGQNEAKGSTGSEIDFKVNFIGKCPENGSRHAIIRVEYHNYSCHHLIFVQQGNAPVELIPGGTKWHTCNLLSATEEVSTPVDEGSLFKFGNVTQPIAASNQTHEKDGGYWINITPNDFKDDVNKDFKIVGTSKTEKWANITSSTKTNSPEWINELNLPKGGRIASYNDYAELFKSEEIEQGYGVLYGDEASEPATDRRDVYEYRSEGTTKGRGMRGCFVYNSTTGRSVFFPIGASGYGRRKNQETNGTAVLRYANRTEQYPPKDGLANKPLFYDLYMRPGAIYWLEKEAKATDNNNVIGWDFNFFTFDFNKIDTGNVFKVGASDGCFVRCVEE